MLEKRMSLIVIRGCHHDVGVETVVVGRSEASAYFMRRIEQTPGGHRLRFPRKAMQMKQYLHCGATQQIFRDAIITIDDFIVFLNPK